MERSTDLRRGDGPFLVPVLGRWEPLAVTGDRNERVAAIAAVQRSRVKRAQLLAAAIPAYRIRTMRGSGWLRTRFPGVYVVGYAPDGELTRETEAVLACPDGALLGGVTSGATWSFIPWRLARGD